MLNVPMSHAKYEPNTFKDKEVTEILLKFHGNLVAVAMKYADDPYCSKEA